MKLVKKIWAAAMSLAFALCCSVNVAASVPAATGNTEQGTYIAVLVIAGILVIGAVVAGVIGKKKK